VNLGAANISASAPGFESGAAAIQVSASLTFVPPSLTINGTSTQAFTINLSAPAPAGGLVINASSSAPSVATVPSFVTFAAGATSVSLPVTGVTLGSAVIHAGSAPNVPDATANVTVQNPGSIVLPPNTVVGLGKSTDFVVSLPSPAPAGGVTINLNSSDTSRVTIAPATLSIAAGQTAPASQPQVTGVNLGQANVTASAPGFTSASVPVQVSANLVFAPLSLTISGAGAQNLTLTLSGPAPSGGLTVNLTSSNTAAATVPPSLTFPASATSINVPVTPGSPGTTTITASAAAPNIADATASVTVQQAGAVVLPPVILTSLGQSVVLAVSLSAPAPAGGVTVTLSSSDTSRATVSPATLTIAAGQTTPASQPQVTGVNVGSANISASAPGYGAATAAVQIGATVAFTPASLTVVVSSTQNAPLSLSAPAPPGGLALSISSSNPGVADVPLTIVFPAGATSVNVPVTGLATGSTVIHAVGFNIPDTTLAVTVIPASLGVIGITNATVGKNLETAITISIPSPAPLGGMSVQLTSSDSTKLLIAGRPGDVGTDSLTVKVPEGLTVLTGIYLQALAGTGTVNVTAGSNGYTPGVATVTLAPSGFVLVGPNGPGVASFSTNQGLGTTLTVFAARLDQALSFVEPQLLRGGATASVNVLSSDPTVGTITGSPLAFTGGVSSATVGFIALNPGSTILSVSVPSDFSSPAEGTNLTAAVISAGLVPASVAVGNQLETTANIALNGAAPPEGLIIVLTSSDPAKLQLSNNAGDAGSASITVQVQGNHSTSLDFFVQGKAIGGTVTYTATAPGFGSNTGTVTLQPSGIVIAGPFGFGNPLLTTISAPPSQVTVSAAMLDSSGNVVQTQAVAGGTSVSVNVASANPGIGTISVSPVTISGGSVSATTEFQPHAAGSTTIAPGVPAGFSAPSQFGSLLANVLQPGISVTDGITIGQKLQALGTAILGQPAPAGGLQLTLTSSNPAALLLSASQNVAGSASITVTVPTGQVTVNYYLQSLGNSSTVSYSASATGYVPRTGNVQLVPSGIVIAGPLGLGLGFASVSLAAGGTTPLSISTVQLDPATDSIVGVQPLAGGQSISVSLTNSTPGVGTVVSPVTLTGGNDTVTSSFNPLSLGSTTVSVNQPPGFTTPAKSALLMVQVNP
jgi:hypothetical protein